MQIQIQILFSGTIPSVPSYLNPASEICMQFLCFGCVGLRLYVLQIACGLKTWGGSRFRALGFFSNLISRSKRTVECINLRFAATLDLIVMIACALSFFHELFLGFCFSLVESCFRLHFGGYVFSICLLDLTLMYFTVWVGWSCSTLWD